MDTDDSRNSAQRELALIPEDAPLHHQLSVALDICSGGALTGVPDHYSFRTWIGPKLILEQQDIADDSWMSMGSFALTQMMKLGEKVRSGDASVHDHAKLRLLCGVFSGDRRGRELVSTLLAEPPSSPEEAADDALEAASADLRLAFFFALDSNLPRDAAVILGRMHRATLHDGEYEFLNGLFHFRSGDFIRAAKLFSRVPVKSIDGPRAAYLTAKAYAILGEPGRGRAPLAIVAQRITTCQWLHLLELAGFHGDPEKAQALVEGLMPNGDLIIKPADRGYAQWAKFHVRLTLSMAERIKEIEDSFAAQHATVSEDRLIQLFSSDKILRRCQVTLMLGVGGAAPEDPKRLVGILEPLVHGGDPEAYRLGFEILYRLGKFENFMSEFAVHWHAGNIEELKDSDLLGLGLSIASLTSHPLARHILKALTELGAGSKDVLEKSNRERIARSLSPMGRQSFLGAAVALDHAIAHDRRWSDAGLIALGFFRVVEIELNERLIRPAARALNFDEVQQVLAEMDNRRRKMWKRHIEGLRQAVHEDSNGFMLGAIRNLLDSVFPVSAEPDNLSRLIAVAFDDLLSEAGRHAARRGALRSLVGEDRVRAYRNPPAHGTYIGLDTALRCEKEVTNLLDEIATWLAEKPASSGS